jgi:DNA-binding NarL/FixJ family response regulator
MVAARVLIADDFPAIRKGVRAILEGRLGTEVCGEAGDGEEAVEKAIALKPDLIMLDISMPNMDGFEAARRILAVSSDTPILLFSTNLTSGHVSEAKRIGCRGYVYKGASARLLVRAIEALLGGHKFFPKDGNGWK